MAGVKDIYSVGGSIWIESKCVYWYRIMSKNKWSDKRIVNIYSGMRQGCIMSSWIRGNERIRGMGEKGGG